MPLFRYHRGGLHESLQTTIIVKSLEELRAKIMVNVSEMYLIEDPENFEIQVMPYPSDNNFDPRIGWFTQMVTMSCKNIRNTPVGFLSEPLES